jgi:hypothetical protein
MLGRSFAVKTRAQPPPHIVFPPNFARVQNMAHSSPQHDPADADRDPHGINAEDRGRLATEDSKAWRAVTGLLLLIVVGGVLLGALGVFLASLAELQ